MSDEKRYELVVGKFDPYSDEVAITQDYSVVAHVYGKDAGKTKALALAFVRGAEVASENARLRERVAALEGADERADAADSRALALADTLAEVMLLVHYKGHGGLPAACDERTCVTGRQLVVAARESVVDSLAESFERALAGQEAAS